MPYTSTIIPHKKLCKMRKEKGQNALQRESANKKCTRAAMREICNTSLAFERFVQKSDNSMEEAILESGGRSFQILCRMREGKSKN